MREERDSMTGMDPHVPALGGEERSDACGTAASSSRPSNSEATATADTPVRQRPVEPQNSTLRSIDRPDQSGKTIYHVPAAWHAYQLEPI